MIRLVEIIDYHWVSDLEFLANLRFYTEFGVLDFDDDEIFRLTRNKRDEKGNIVGTGFCGFNNHVIFNLDLNDKGEKIDG